MYQISTDFAGANLRVLSAEEHSAQIEVDLRDTVTDWFFWCFRVDGAAGQTITFTFPSEERVGYFGAAVSYDLRNWHWQYPDPTHNGGAFTYTFGAEENSVYFAHDMVYRPERFFDFARARSIPLKTLCISERGREVPYIDTEKGDEVLFFTARHHACESPGSYLAEGLLSELLDLAGEQYRIICVPMVDYDGVADGDQGKNRNGSDHNRDYGADRPARYATTRAIRQMVEGGLRLRLGLDFHAPYHLGGLGGQNDTLFVPLDYNSEAPDVEAFLSMVKAELPSEALEIVPAEYFPEGVSWNVNSHRTCSDYLTRMGAALSACIETPYFITHDTPFTAERGVNTGRAFARAIAKYLAKG